MSTADNAREAFRARSGKFGEQTHSEHEITLDPAADGPVLWKLDLNYVSGPIESIIVDETGHLPKIHKSERLYLTDLLGFKATRLSPQIDLTLAEALADPGDAISFYPVFDTTEGFPTTVYGQVFGLREAR